MSGVPAKLQLLGPIDLVVGQRRLNIGGPRMRVVLAMMALNVNRVTPVDQLVDAVWDDAPPSTARGQIQICISALRKLFVDARQLDPIKTRPPGYLLELGTEQLDTEEFTALVAVAKTHAAAGRSAEAAATLRESLALWRGPALAGVSSSLVERGAAFLNDLRFTALEERIRLDLELGRHQQVTGELQALCAEYPFREQLYGFLMLALYRSGRQAEALDVRRRARATLIEEVGIEPSPELQNLERAILDRAPELDLPSESKPAAPQPAGPEQPAAEVDSFHVPRQLPASVADFTGRQRQIEQIQRLLAETRDPYAVRIVTISGKGGVGKSSLAIRVAHELGDAFPDGHLYADLRAYNDDNPTFGVLGRFLRALGVNGTSVPEDPTERAELYRSRVANKRILVILDDVASEERVLPLLPGSPTCAVIVTSRSRMSGLNGGHGVNIDVFDEDQSLELLSKIVGAQRVQLEHDASSKLTNLCGGLPLALRIAGARLASRPHGRISALVQRLADEARRLDEFSHHGLALRSAIDLTYRGLDATAERLFRLFSLMRGPDFPSWTAAALLDTDLFEAEDALERLVDAQVLDTVEYPGAPLLRYRFHDLIRVFAHEQVMRTESEEERRAALGRVLGAWLGLGEQAHRMEYGGDFTILHGSAPRWHPPGPAADIIDTPTAWWETERRSLVAAIKQAAVAGFDELCWDLALTTVSLFEVGCYFDDWRATAEWGLCVTERKGNERGRAAMLYSVGSLAMVQQRLRDAQSNLTQALELFEIEGDPHGRALVLRNSAYVHGLRGNSIAMLTGYRISLDLMRQVGDRIGEAHVLRAMAKHCIDEGDTDAAREMLEQALEICHQVKSKRCEAQVMHRFAELYLRTDEIDAARQALHQVLLIVRDRGDQIGEVYALYGLGILRFREGRLDNAATTLGHALELAKQVGERLVEGQAEHALGDVSIARGNPVAGAAHLTTALAIFDELDSTPWRAKTLTLLSDAHSTTGDTELARELLDQASRLLADADSA